MLLDAKYTFEVTHTVLEIIGMRLVYILPENIAALRDEFYDHAFILHKSPSRPVVDWKKIKGELRKRIHAVAVRRPSSYMNGCALMLPSSIAIERDEVLVSVEDHIARLYSYRVNGRQFVPHHLRDSVLTGEAAASALAKISGQPLIDITTMSCPSKIQTESQLHLL